jgi:hypothetical protein
LRQMSQKLPFTSAQGGHGISSALVGSRLQQASWVAAGPFSAQGGITPAGVDEPPPPQAKTPCSIRPRVCSIS